MDFRIALDKDNYELSPDGKSAKSNIIYIPPGHVALLSLYNMTTVIKLQDDPNGKKVLANESCISLRKLSFGPVDESTIKIICGHRVNVAQELANLLVKRRVFSEYIYQNCCEWTIDPANNFVLIPVPGFFELELSDLDQLDTAYVEYAILTAEQSIAIPDGFKLGG